jgi:hypothetical protein
MILRGLHDVAAPQLSPGGHWVAYEYPAQVGFMILRKNRQ